MSYPAITLAAARWRQEELLREAASERLARQLRSVDRRSTTSPSIWNRSLARIRMLAEAPRVIHSLRATLRMTPTT